MFDVPRSLEEISAETAALLHQAGVQLAVAEAGTDGEILRLLRVTDEGAAVLTRGSCYSTAGELASGMRVSPAKVEAFGEISAMVAAEAAAELIDTYEGGWGLVVMAPAGNQPPVPGVTTSGPAQEQGFIALGTPSTTIIQQCPPEQAVRATLKLLREQALRRLAVS